MKLILFLAFWASAAAPHKLGTERLVFKTDLGDLVFALFPEAAPKHSAQFLKLMRGGAYDSCHFYRLEPGFVLQTAVAQDRLIPMTPAQLSLIKKIPDESKNGLPHARGLLSMARPDEDANGAETSFSIMLGRSPHLDGKYTVFGVLERGADVLRALESVSTDAQNRPHERLTIRRAFVAESVSELEKIPLSGAKQEVLERRGGEDYWAGLGDPRQKVAVAGLLWGALSGVAVFFLVGRVSIRSIVALTMTNALVSGFALFVLLNPAGKRTPWLSAVLFLGLMGLFKLMSRFENAD